MIYYFLDKNDNEQTFTSIADCRAAAKEDSSVLKFRDNTGGEYHI